MIKKSFLYHHTENGTSDIAIVNAKTKDIAIKLFREYYISVDDNEVIELDVKVFIKKGVYIVTDY